MYNSSDIGTPPGIMQHVLTARKRTETTRNSRYYSMNSCRGHNSGATALITALLQHCNSAAAAAEVLRAHASVNHCSEDEEEEQSRDNRINTRTNGIRGLSNTV